MLHKARESGFTSFVIKDYETGMILDSYSRSTYKVFRYTDELDFVNSERKHTLDVGDMAIKDGNHWSPDTRVWDGYKWIRVYDSDMKVWEDPTEIYGMDGEIAVRSLGAVRNEVTVEIKASESAMWGEPMNPSEVAHWAQPQDLSNHLDYKYDGDGFHSCGACGLECADKEIFELAAISFGCMSEQVGND